MWLILAVLSAVFAGLVSVTVKVGMKNVDSNLGTFLRTAVVLVFTFIMTLIVNSLGEITAIKLSEWLYITASGLCTGLSWLCYFKALQLTQINKVAAVDKLSTVLTMTFAIIIFNEPFWWLTFVAMGVMLTGTLLMLGKKKAAPQPLQPAAESKSDLTDDIPPQKAARKINFNSWFIFAVLSLIFASFTSILAKLGMQSVNSNLGTFLRTVIVLLMSFFIVLGKGKLPEIKKMTKFNYLFLIVSGVLTGASWLCYYGAIKSGNLSVVVPIDKLSIIISVVFSCIFLKEKLSAKALTGLILLTGGTLLLLI